MTQRPNEKKWNRKMHTAYLSAHAATLFYGDSAVASYAPEGRLRLGEIPAEDRQLVDLAISAWTSYGVVAEPFERSGLDAHQDASP